MHICGAFAHIWKLDIVFHTLQCAFHLTCTHQYARLNKLDGSSSVGHTNSLAHIPRSILVWAWLTRFYSSPCSYWSHSNTILSRFNTRSHLHTTISHTTTQITTTTIVVHYSICRDRAYNSRTTNNHHQEISSHRTTNIYGTQY